MQERQRVNVKWMREVMDRHDLNAAQWAKKAKEVAEANGQACTLSGPTITKAMKDSYPFVTKAVTLEQLAAAVGETAPAETGEPDYSIPLPSTDALEAMIRTYFEQLGASRASGALIGDLAIRMHESLSSLREDPDAARIPEAARSAALHIGRAHDR